MPNITQVNLTSGVPSGPAGPATVSTLDNLIGTVATPCANIQTIQGVAAGVPVPVSGSVGISGSVAVTGTFWQATQPVSGTFWQATQPISAASLPLPAGAATSVNQATAAAAASTTSGQTGHLALGAVTTAAPSYANATSNFLSLTPVGALRVDGSAVTQPISGNVGVTGTVGVTQSTSPWVTSVSGTVSCTQSGNWTARVVGNAGAIFDFSSAQNQATPASALLIGGEFNTVPTTIVSGNSSPLQLDSAGNLLVNVKTSGPLTVVPAITASNPGYTQSRVVSAASTNSTSLKGAAGNIAAIDVYNVAAYMVFLKLYNKATAPTVGTDTPVWTIPLPANGSYSTEFPVGEYFSLGIGYAITKLQADSDTTAVAVGDVTGRIKWI